MTTASAFHFESLVWDCTNCCLSILNWYFGRASRTGGITTSVLPQSGRQ